MQIEELVATLASVRAQIAELQEMQRAMLIELTAMMGEAGHTKYETELGTVKLKQDWEWKASTRVIAEQLKPQLKELKGVDPAVINDMISKEVVEPIWKINRTKLNSLIRANGEAREIVEQLRSWKDPEVEVTWKKIDE